ncbi:MAG TPA: hypothetical protein VII40_11690 [Xanthobacteraceae bacterium]|jgi:hypothetical protein
MPQPRRDALDAGAQRRGIAGVVSLPALSSSSFSMMTVLLLRDPRGRPAGLPLWPG